MSGIFRCLVITVICVVFVRATLSENENILSRKSSTVLIAILVRNKAHILPYFLNYLEKLNYPKDRLSLWIRSDHNEDNSLEIVQTWLNRTGGSYHSYDIQYDTGSSRHPHETTIADWPIERFEHIIKLKEEALEKANKMWADFIFFLDADVLLTEPNTLKYLTDFQLPIVAPMLLSDGLYSNFWCGMSNDYYYERTDDYREILSFRKMGNFPVPMVHSAVLINLKLVELDQLTFDHKKLLDHQSKAKLKDKKYNGPVDDIIVFAISAKSAGIEMIISNEYQFGYILSPLDKDEAIYRDYQQLINIKLSILTDLNQNVEDISADLKKFVQLPQKDRISLDRIYMINLVRRPERRMRMENSFNEMGLDVEHIEAVDGRELDLKIIEEMGIRFLPGYEDPYNHRQMTMGEIGCFLSHYKIWKRMIELGLKEVLILEDDIRFESYFKEKAARMLEEARQLGEWDLVYFGRKRLEDQEEPLVDETTNLVKVGYSYWTLGYVISATGAQKLLAIDPLRKLIPVDEFLPVMFDRHPNKTWSRAFEPRNLIAYSVAPLLVFPTHYTGEDGYISDTEDSELTPIKFAADSDAQLKSDKARETYSEVLTDDRNMDNKHTNNVEASEANGQHDQSEL